MWAFRDYYVHFRWEKNETQEIQGSDARSPTEGRRPRFALDIQHFPFPLYGEDEFVGRRSKPPEAPAKAGPGAHT